MHLNLHKTFSTPHGGGGPGSGPVACKAFLEPFLPVPVLVQDKEGANHWNYDRPQSVGRVRAFYGNTGMFIRALAYILANGPDGLRQTTEDAVLNATTFARSSKTSTNCPTRPPRCTKWSSATSARRPSASKPATSPSALSTTASIPTR